MYVGAVGLSTVLGMEWVKYVGNADRLWTPEERNPLYGPEQKLVCMMISLSSHDLPSFIQITRAFASRLRGKFGLLASFFSSF
jgi:hypothetical protein